MYTEIVIRLIVERLNLLLHFDYSVSDPMDLVLSGLVDPVKIFVKCEPHKLSKLEEKRLRLIFSMSIVDNTIAKILFAPQNRAEIDTWETIFLKPGMGLHDEALGKIMNFVCENSPGGLVEADMKGWDWSFQSHDFLADLNRRLALNGARGTLWERVARAHYFCVARKVMVLSDGTMYKQLRPGIMPSGWYNTSSTNSAVRVINHAYAALKEGVTPWCMAMGDDSVERYVPNLEAHYLSLGKVCGMINVVNSDSFEFCSTKFENGKGVPVNIAKQLMNMLHNPPTLPYMAAQRFEQFCYELRHYPDLPRLMLLITQSGWWVKSYPL